MSRAARVSTADADTAAGVASLLAAAAERVRADTRGWAVRALSAPSAHARLDDIVYAASTGHPLSLGSDATTAEKGLCRHLIDLLRRELLAGSPVVADVPARPGAPGRTDEPGGAGNAALLELLRRLETLRNELEPEWHESLATGLTGLDALALLVEVAHDLRSPLTSIMFLAETLRRGHGGGRLSEIERQQLGIIYSAALNLSGVASDLIDLARGEAHPTASADADAPFSVGELLERVRGMVAPMAEEKGLELVFVGPRDDGRIGDSVALSRILLNLTTNALKFTDAGRIELRVLERQASRLEFSVQDTGPGMDQATVATLFEPFRRSRSRSGFQFSGTGLGLAITRRILELMGSSLQLETAPGEGSRFFFEIELPLAEGQ
jgi:signal transduction histidine kinase